MFMQLLITADDSGQATPGRMSAYDADLLIDPVTEQTYRGPWRAAELSDAAKHRICDAVNAELAGSTKAVERLTALKAKAPKKN
jgi:hypothetical protein